MPDTVILGELFKNTSLMTLQGAAARPRVILTEPDVEDSTATISGLPSDAFVIKVDDFRSPNKIFQCAHGECKRADYVIISEQKKCILYVELKRTKDGWSKIVQQLIGAKCFIIYCQHVGRQFWNENSFLSGYSHRYVSIAHTSISKKPTRMKRNSSINDAPSKAMKVDWPKNLQFKQLTGI